MTSPAAHGKIELMNSRSPFRPPTLDTKHIPLFILGVWVAYLVLSPFYVFPKGRPQPADFILLLGMAPVIASLFMNFKSNKIKTTYLFGGLFVCLTIIINVVNYLFFPDIRFLLTALIYPYNFMVFIFTAWLFQKNPEKVIRYTFWGLVATVIIQIQVTYLFDFGFRGYRGTAGFENPNQLAYWTLLTAAMVVFLRRGKSLRWQEWGLLILLGFLQSLALSKAGIIAYSVFIIFLFLTPKISKITYVLGGSALLIGSIYALNDPVALNKIYDHIEPLKNVAARLEGIGTEADDSPEARGYYRIVEYPMYSVLGSGEGAFYRFNEEGYNRELHSGIATIIFSYGIFGATLFSLFLFLVIYKQPWYYILLFVPIIMFGLPHQNFRFAHFWVFLGINYGLFLSYYKQQAIDKMTKLNKKPTGVINHDAS